jgi:hypothetical protein
MLALTPMLAMAASSSAAAAALDPPPSPRGPEVVADSESGSARATSVGGASRNGSRVGLAAPCVSDANCSLNGACDVASGVCACRAPWTDAACDTLALLPVPSAWPAYGRNATNDAPALKKAMAHMAGAITAMQFQDMATQLIAHTGRRLRNCADRIARDTMGDDEDGAAVLDEAPLRPNPVTQDEMDAGSIELF